MHKRAGQWHAVVVIACEEAMKSRTAMYEA
jgi:hypothetical protein